MKMRRTTISIPEDIYRDDNVVAKRLGMSRSRFYRAAVARDLSRYRKENITARLNEVYANDASGVDPLLAAMQLVSIPKEEW